MEDSPNAELIKELEENLSKEEKAYEKIKQECEELKNTINQKRVLQTFHHNNISKIKREIEKIKEADKPIVQQEVDADLEKENQKNLMYVAYRMCSRKKVYSSSHYATKVAERMTEQTGEKLKSYKCPICNSYHVGHSTQVAGI
jgi:glycerophosphoryl diester phosphodiesterase